MELMTYLAKRWELKWSQICSEHQSHSWCYVLLAQEEFRRTGMHGPAMVSEPKKPLAQEVFRALTNGFEVEVKLMELYVTDAENSSCCTTFENQTPFSLSMRALIDAGNVVGFGFTNPKNNITKTLELSKASDGIRVFPS
ncbi:hypothetical protein LguiA_007622 [Lonicera macranthoides]